MRFWLLMASAVALAAIGCGGDDEGGSGGAGNTSSAGGNGGSATGTGGSATGTGGSATGMGGGFGDICNDAYNDACIDCTQATCCDQLEACTMDPDCQELLNCFLDGTSPPSCLGMVNQSDEVLNLTACATAECGVDCT